MLTRHTALRTGSLTGPGARVCAALFITGAFVLSGCGTADTGTPVAQSESDYEYSSAGFEKCLDDADVTYRKDSDGSIDIVNSTNPDITAATDRCTELTSRPATDAATQYQNAMTSAIADCLEGLGYHVTTSESSDDLSDGNGNDIATYTVPEAERSSTSYNSDTDNCMQEATAAIPSP